MKGVLFDLPYVTERAKQRIADAGLDGTLRSYGRRCPHLGARWRRRLYSLPSYLHDWDDDQAVTILKNCHRAMTEQGKLLLIERVLPARVDSSLAQRKALVLSDLNMMVIERGA